MDAETLRALTGKRVLVQFDSGSQLIGRVVRCSPELGAVHLVEMERVTVVSREGVVLRELAEHLFVPATPSGVSELR
jgi:primosomal protein N'